MSPRMPHQPAWNRPPSALQYGQYGDARQAKPLLGLIVLGILVPHQEEAQQHHQPVNALVACHAALGVVDENTHQKQCQGAGQDVADGAAHGVSFIVAILQGVRNGHAHGKEEHGEHNVRKPHAVFHGGCVQNPFGSVQDRPHVVHRYHEHHGKGAEYVYGKVSLVHIPKLRHLPAINKLGVSKRITDNDVFLNNLNFSCLLVQNN